MALYLGNQKVKLYLNGELFCLNFFDTAPIVTGIRLFSSDGYVLRDSNGLYLIAKDGDE